MAINHSACIEACNRCAAYCDHCAVSCLEEGNREEMAECIRLDLQCAAICRLAAQYLAQDSRFAIQLCELCAEVCKACGEECGKHDHDHCRECADACMACVRECSAMLA